MEWEKSRIIFNEAPEFVIYEKQGVWWLKCLQVADCLRCDFYRDNQCTKAGKYLSQITDEKCLAKLQVILLQDLVQLFEEYLYEDEEE